ncbi:MAG: carbohydrate ABC transporter permease [Planctomycetota bacterium]
MPILPTVGRRSLRMRLVVVAIYVLLVLGGVTMVVPFLITLTGAVSNKADFERYDILPAYFGRRDLRFAKFLAEKYAGIRFEHFATAHGAPAGWSSFKDLGFEDDLGRYWSDLDEKGEAELERIASDYDEFLATYDTGNMFALFGNWGLKDCRRFLREKYVRLVREGDAEGRLSGRAGRARALELLSKAWNEGVYEYWDLLNFEQEQRYPYHLRRWIPPDEPRYTDYLEYLEWLPAAKKVPVTTRYLWCLFLLDKNIRVAEIDREFGTDFQSIYRIPPGDIVRLPGTLGELWRRFVSESWPVRLVELDPGFARGFPGFLEDRYRTIEAMNAGAGTSYGSFADVPASTRLPGEIGLRRLWVEFALGAPKEKVTRLSVEKDYRAFLRAKYGDVKRLNDAYGWRLARFELAELPLREVDRLDYLRNSGYCFWKFLSHNMGEVLSFVAVRGRALWNTGLLVALTVFFTLTVNPMAAYALSRFRLRYSQQILIYLLATMAFPPEVGMIPGFLLLRDLHLLNTFPALILPGAANGFTVFLLKGFFDSLPRELYEAATVDGAGEFKMFTSITLALSKPILAVIALQAFLVSYGSFMWAFLVCQDPDMWTLMVWLYQFQAKNGADPHLIMAAIVIASVPTLVVFAGCQKIILRGIVLPTMK